MTPMSRADFRFFHPLRVRWGEVDAQGVVFNPNYLAFADVAGTEYMRAVGVSPHDMHDLYVVNANVDFLGSARFDDALDIGVGTGRIGRTSLGLKFGLFRVESGDDLLLTRIALTYVRVDPQTRRACPLDAVMVERLTAFEAGGVRLT